MKQIKVPQDVNGEYVGERISLKAGDYVANQGRVGHAVPGQDIGKTQWSAIYWSTRALNGHAGDCR